jgi:hypothetical protein
MSIYRTGVPYDHSRSNESRANLAEHALSLSTDENANDEPGGAFLDVSDMLANLRHFCDRAGIDFGEVDDHAHNGYLGDLGEDPVTIRDTERFPPHER